MEPVVLKRRRKPRGQWRSHYTRYPYLKRPDVTGRWVLDKSREWRFQAVPDPGQAVMQGDGNFVIYDSGGTPLAWTATEGNPGAYLTVQPDGNVVVYTATAPNAAIWYSNGAGCL